MGKGKGPWAKVDEHEAVIVGYRAFFFEKRAIRRVFWTAAVNEASS